MYVDILYVCMMFGMWYVCDVRVYYVCTLYILYRPYILLNILRGLWRDIKINLI